MKVATANRALLTYMLDATKLTNRVQLHPFAASNVTQEMTVFKGLYAGDERGESHPHAMHVARKTRRRHDDRPSHL